MADSDIQLSGLTAVGGVGQTVVTWSVTEASCIPYLRLDKVEVWEATTNNRAAATKIVEVFGTQIARTGLARNVTRFYWVRPRDISGNLGDWFPAGANAGVSATTRDEVPPAGSVGRDQVQAGAITADKIDVTNLSAITANLGTMTAGTINGGTINGGTVTGAVIRTAASGERVEISGTQIIFLPGGMTPSMVLRAVPGNTALTVSWSIPSVPLSIFQNNSTGAAARFQGNGNNPAVVEVIQTGGTSAGNRALSARNAQSGGGHGYVGMPSASGGYAFYSQAGGFAPFTGQHDAVILKGADVNVGDIVFDVKVIARGSIDDTLTEVAVSEEVQQAAVLGVVSRRSDLDPYMVFAALPRSENETSGEPTFVMQQLAKRYDFLVVNSLGEGQINACGRGGDIKRGDLLVASSMRGKAERQDDKIMCSYTVAKAREDVTFDHPDQWRRVACIYHCG